MNIDTDKCITRKNSEGFVNLVKRIERAGDDPLLGFIAEKYKEDLEEIRKNNVKCLFNIARNFGVRFLFLGKGEIAGCENIRFNNRPAIWSIAETADIYDGCGNRDQAQTSDARIDIFPKDSYGAWDLVDNIKLPDEEITNKKFRRVVTLREYPYFR